MASNHKTILGSPNGLKINDRISASIPVLISCLMKHAIPAIKVKLDNSPKNMIPILEMNSKNAISTDKIMVTGNKTTRIAHLMLSPLLFFLSIF